MGRQMKSKTEKPMKRKSCLLCRIRKLKCVSDSEHLHLNNGEVNPCGNCMIYKAKCEPYAGSSDRSLIKYLSEEEYNDLVKEKEKLQNKKENAAQNYNTTQESASATPEKRYVNMHDDRANFQTAYDMHGTNDFSNYVDNSLTYTSTKNTSSYLNESAGIFTEEEFYREFENINLLKNKLSELRDIINSHNYTGSSLGQIVTNLEEEILTKDQNLKTFKMNQSYYKDFVNWDVDKLRESTNKKTYDRSDSMHTNVPIDKFDILNHTKKATKRNIREVNGVEDDKEVKEDNKCLENQLLKFSGFKQVCLDPVLCFDLNTDTGETIPNATESCWYSKDTSLKYLPIVFGKYNTDAFISKGGFETVMREIISKNPNFEILSERDLKATLFLVLKFIQYHLSCENMAIDIYTDPFEYFGNDLIEELTTISKTSDKVLLLYSKLPISLISETLKKYPKFKETHKNFNKMVNESSYSSTLFQYFVVLTTIHQETIRQHIYNFFVEGDSSENDTRYADSLRYFEVEDILLILSIHFSEKSKFCSAESLDFIESILLKFEQQFAFINKHVFSEILSSFVRCVLEIGLHKFENYLGLDEVTAEKRRKLFWKAVYWDTKIQMSFGNAPLINIKHATCLLPKFFINSGVVTISDLKWFLLNKGFAITTAANLSIENKLEILNVSCSIITSDFMTSVLFNSDYTSLISLLKMDPSIHNNRLRRLLEKIDYYNKFNTMFAIIIKNVYKEIMANENGKLAVEHETLIQLKYLISTSSMCSYMLTSSLSLISRLQNTCSDEALLQSSKEKIDMFSNMVFENDCTTLNISLISRNSILSLKSNDVLGKAYSNIIYVASSYSKDIPTDLFLCTLRVHRSLRLCSQKLISKDTYSSKNTIHRVHSYASLFTHKIRLSIRTVAQLYMAQQGLRFEDLQEYIRSLPDFVTDKVALEDELDVVFDTSLFENDAIADRQLSRNKKRYDEIVKKFKKIGSGITRAASSKDLSAKMRSNKRVQLPKLSALTNTLNVEGSGMYGVSPGLSNNGSPMNMTRKGPYGSEMFMKNTDVTRNATPSNYPPTHNMMNTYANTDPQPKASQNSPDKFSQSNERLQQPYSIGSIDGPRADVSDSSNSVISTNNATASSTGLSYKGEQMGNGRNMVERIDVGTMEDFLTNQDFDSFFSTFWDGFNMD